MYYFAPTQKGLLGTQIYYDRFEEGENPWNVDGELNAGGGTNALTTIQTDGNALSGTKVLRMRADDTTTGTIAQTNNFRYHSFDNTNDILVSFKFLMPQVIDHEDNFDSFTNFWQVKGTNNTDRNDPLWVLGIKNRGGKAIGGANYLSLSYLGQFWPELGITKFTVEEIGVTNIEVGVWHKVQIRYERNNGNGQIQIYQNGNLTHTATGAQTFPSAYVPYVYHSINNYGDGRVSKDAGGISTGLGYSDILVENYGIYEYGGRVVPAQPVETNLAPLISAAAPMPYEENTVAGWSISGGTMASVATDPQNGTYCIYAEATSVSYGNRLHYPQAVESGKLYTYRHWVKTTAPNASFRIFQGDLVRGTDILVPYISDGQWHEYVITGIDPSGTSINMRHNMMLNTGGASIGDAIYLDNRSFEEE